MNSIILHISDLHISLDKKIGGGENKHDSYLSTSDNNEPSILYIDKFIETIKSDYDIDDTIIYLLVTGDITNEGEKKEFDYAFIFLKRIIDSLKINISNHCCPIKNFGRLIFLYISALNEVLVCLDLFFTTVFRIQ